MTIEERLREALTEAFRSVQHWPTPDQITRLMTAIAARGLAVCEVSSGEPTCKDFLQVNREQAIARVLDPSAFDKASMTSWGANAKSRRRTALLKARAIIAADPWTKQEKLETVALKTAYVDGYQQAITDNDYDGKFANPEDAWQSSDCKQTIDHFGSFDDGSYSSIYEEKSGLRAEVERLRASLRDLLHLLDTAEGLWVTDKPILRPVQYYDGGFMVPTGETELLAKPNTYFRQTFRDTEAVKRARKLVEQFISVGRQIEERS